MIKKINEVEIYPANFNRDDGRKISNARKPINP